VLAPSISTRAKIGYNASPLAARLLAKRLPIALLEIVPLPMPTALLTGFPGFLASAFLPDFLSRTDAQTRVTCLVQSHFRAMAEDRARRIADRHPEWKDRIQIVEGDITQPQLALKGGTKELQADTREVYHFAAIYDLAVPRTLGMKINVDGTRHVLDFIAGCPAFDRLHYVSTCYVSGRHPGAFTERDLSVCQRFNNYYEETKYLAEVDVQERMKHGLSTTIYRPSIVVGDSKTGETQKYDGPYGALRYLVSWKKTAPMSTVGNPKKFHVNFTPRDFVVAALCRLSALPQSRGKVYQLCDPEPPTVAEIYEIFSQATGRRVLQIPTWTPLMKGLLRIPGAAKATHITPESIDYFTHPTAYTCENTLADLAGTGLSCPRFRDYAPMLVRFMQEHPEVSDKAMH
jgi:thioester reductase-like protein